MDIQIEGQAPAPEWQNVNEGSPKLSQPRADSQQAIVVDDQQEQPPINSSQTRNLAEENNENPDQIAVSETVKETLVNGDQPKQALTLEAEKPSSGTADNTVPNITNAVQNNIPAPVNNDQNPEISVGTNNQTNVIQEVNSYGNIPSYYHQPEYQEPKEEKLFYITMNTYQACRLNSQLCNYGMRVEPVDMNKKPKPKPKQNNGKRPQVKKQPLAYNSQYHQIRQDIRPIPVSISAQLEAIGAQIPQIQRANILEESKLNDINQGYITKQNDGSDESGLGAKIMRVDTQNMQEESEMAGLFPSPQRMSARNQHVVGKYVDLASGRVKQDENEIAGITAHTQLQRAASTISNKPAQATNNNKKNIEENKAKIKALLENIKHHEFFNILQQSLDVLNPTYEPFKSEYKIFTLIEIQFDDNRYQNSNQIKTDIFQQLQIRINMYTSNETELKNTISLFNSVKGWFELCDNLILVEAPADKRPKPLAPGGGRRPPPRPAPQPKPPAPRPENGGGSQAPLKISFNTVPPEMSPEDKNRLKNNIGLLTQEQKKKVVPIVKKCLQGQGNNNPIFEFELDQLTNECLRELESYVDKEIKSNEKKRKRKEADKLRRQKRIQSKAEKPAANNKYPYAQAPGLEIPPAAGAAAADGALAGQSKIGGAVQPSQMAIQQQIAQLTQLSQQQLQAQQMQTLLAQLQQNQAFPGMPAPVPQHPQQFQRPPQGQPANVAAQPPARKAQSESSSSSSDSD